MKIVKFGILAQPIPVPQHTLLRRRTIAYYLSQSPCKKCRNTGWKKEVGSQTFKGVYSECDKCGIPPEDWNKALLGTFVTANLVQELRESEGQITFQGFLTCLRPLKVRGVSGRELECDEIGGYIIVSNPPNNPLEICRRIDNIGKE